MKSHKREGSLLAGLRSAMAGIARVTVGDRYVFERYTTASGGSAITLRHYGTAILTLWLRTTEDLHKPMVPYVVETFFAYSVSDRNAINKVLTDLGVPVAAVRMQGGKVLLRSWGGWPWRTVNGLDKAASVYDERYLEWLRWPSGVFTGNLPKIEERTHA